MSSWAEDPTAYSGHNYREVYCDPEASARICNLTPNLMGHYIKSEITL